MAALYERVYGRSKVKMKGYVAVQKKLLTIVYALWKKDESFDPAYEHEVLKKKGKTSEEKEAVPSLATAAEAEQQQPVKEVILAIETGITQDSHPSKNRRMPSLADSKLH